MKPAFFGWEFRGPDCNVIAEQGGGPDALDLRGPDLARGPEVARRWCRPTFTSKLSVDPSSVLTDVVHPSYISCITLMYSSPTCFFLIAHHIISLGRPTWSYAFSRSTKIICRFWVFSKCFSCIILSAKIYFYFFIFYYYYYYLFYILLLLSFATASTHVDHCFGETVLLRLIGLFTN